MVAASMAAGEVSLEEFQSLAHVSPTEADPDVVWLIVDRAGEEQDADFGQPRTIPGEVIDARDAGKAIMANGGNSFGL